MSSPNIIVAPERFQLAVGVNEDCTVEITNVGYEAVLFRLMTTSPTRYIVKHTKGVVKGNSTAKVVVTLNTSGMFEPGEDKNVRTLKDNFRLEYALLGHDDVVEPRNANVPQLIKNKKTQNASSVYKKMLRCDVLLDVSSTADNKGGAMNGGGSAAAGTQQQQQGGADGDDSRGKSMKEMERNTLMEKKRRAEGAGGAAAQSSSTAVSAKSGDSITAKLKMLLIVAAVVAAMGIWLMME